MAEGAPPVALDNNRFYARIVVVPFNIYIGTRTPKRGLVLLEC